MKKFIYLISSLLLIILSFLILESVFTNNKLNATYYDLDNSIVKLSDIINSEMDTHVIYVDPNCSSCEQISSVYKNIENKTIIIISSYKKEFNYVEYFNKFNSLKNVHFFIDKENNFIDDFNIGFSYSLPLILEFDKNGNQVIK